MIDVASWYIAVTWIGVIMRYTLESNYSRYENVIMLSPSLFEGELSL